MQQNQSTKRARHPEFMVMRGRGVPVTPALPATADSVEAAAVGGGSCNEDGVFCVVMLCCCVV
jgi:hypothetical protein